MKKVLLVSQEFRKEFLNFELETACFSAFEGSSVSTLTVGVRRLW